MQYGKEGNKILCKAGLSPYNTYKQIKTEFDIQGRQQQLWLRNLGDMESKPT